MANSAPVLLWRLLTTVRNWPVYLLNRMGRMEGRQRVRIHFWNGMTMTGRPKSVDRCICNEEWLDRCYEPNDAGIRFNWNASRVIIDIGGHIGGFTLYAAAKAPDARIIAFEPEPTNAAILRENITNNHLESRVTVVENAVAAQAGTLTLHRTFSATGSGGHSLYDYAGEGDDVAVTVTTLPDIFTAHGIERIDFLKIDCEGAEYDMLYQLPDDFFARIGFIALEYHHFSADPRHNGPALTEYLRTKGFTVMSPAKSLLFAYRG